MNSGVFIRLVCFGVKAVNQTLVYTKNPDHLKRRVFQVNSGGSLSTG